MWGAVRVGRRAAGGWAYWWAWMWGVVRAEQPGVEMWAFGRVERQVAGGGSISEPDEMSGAKRAWNSGERQVLNGAGSENSGWLGCESAEGPTSSRRWWP